MNRASETERNCVSELGFALVSDIVSADEVRRLRSELGPATSAGRRGLLAIDGLAAFSQSMALLRLIRPHLPREPRCVRALYFDKSPQMNWSVPWRQDLTLALRRQVDAPGFGPWSCKDGIPHVQPPIRLLEEMLTLRIHLDDAEGCNRALRVLPGSHRFGRLSAEKIRELRREGKEVLCRARAGDVLLMRPLLLHTSGKTTTGGQRRVIHLEYAGFELPSGLEWSQEG